jgi:hypothetical protein
MIEKTLFSPLKGFVLLPPNPIQGYYGIDRHPFEPVLLDQEIDSLAQMQEGESRIWAFYPPGWRRDAYRLYEENLVKEVGEDLFLLSTKEVACEIQRIIEPHIGRYEIVACEVWDLDSIPSLEDVVGTSFSGYDIAYFGGDLYSAILNGLFINPYPDLVVEYKSLLNKYGLFSSAKPIPGYIHRFKELVSSEADSEFCIFRLSLSEELN